MNEIEMDGARVERARQLTRAWVEQMVVGLNLCPFAAPVVRAESIRYSVSLAEDEEALLGDFLRELADLVAQPASQLSTTLLITPQLLSDFDDFLDLLADGRGPAGAGRGWTICSRSPAFIRVICLLAYPPTISATGPTGRHTPRCTSSVRMR